MRKHCLWAVALGLFFPVACQTAEEQNQAELLATSGIHATNDGSVLVAHQCLLPYLSPEGLLHPTADRMIPAVENGRIVGMKVFPPSGGVPKKMGILHGDAIMEVNGIVPSSADAVLRIMERLKVPEEPHSIRVRIIRAGQEIQLTFAIVESPSRCQAFRQADYPYQVADD